MTDSLLQADATTSPAGSVKAKRFTTHNGVVYAATHAEIERHPVWAKCFSALRKDYRFYGIVEGTILQGFDYRYFVLEDTAGVIRAIQPFFLLDQDMLAGTGPLVQKIASKARSLVPRLLTARTLMVGCSTGEGHLGNASAEDAAWTASNLHAALHQYARWQKCALVVMKEFPSTYRDSLRCMAENGYARVPSLPFTRLKIDYKNFDEYMTKTLSKVTRKGLRRKFRTAAEADPITLSIVDDVSDCVDELLPLYLQVYERSPMRFEKLTREFLCRLGREMPDKTRFFVWRQNGKAIAFSLVMLQNDSIYDEYVGLDYSVALDLHLYFYTFRDIVIWGMENGYKWYCSSALNYDPKLRFKSELAPVDLYVRHTSGIANFVLKRVLPWLEPTRGEPILRQFPNYHEIWDRPAPQKPVAANDAEATESDA